MTNELFGLTVRRKFDSGSCYAAYLTAMRDRDPWPFVLKALPMMGWMIYSRRFKEFLEDATEEYVESVADWLLKQDEEISEEALKSRLISLVRRSIYRAMKFEVHHDLSRFVDIALIEEIRRDDGTGSPASIRAAILLKEYPIAILKEVERICRFRGVRRDFFMREADRLIRVVESDNGCGDAPREASALLMFGLRADEAAGLRECVILSIRRACDNVGCDYVV